MGFLSEILRQRDAPRNSTSGSAYSFFLGQSAAGKRVNERTAIYFTAELQKMYIIRIDKKKEELKVFLESEYEKGKQ